MSAPETSFPASYLAFCVATTFLATGTAGGRGPGEDDEGSIMLTAGEGADKGVVGMGLAIAAVFWATGVSVSDNTIIVVRKRTLEVKFGRRQKLEEK